MDIPQLVEQQRAFFKTHITRDVNYRKAALIRLKKELILRQKDITDAIYLDIRKPEFESIFTETGYVLKELTLAIRKVKSWARPEKVLPVLVNFPSLCRIFKDPYGTVLIISPWNFPHQLVFTPLIGAIAAGNTAIIKPSEFTPHTSKIIAEIIASVFEPGHVSIVEGDACVASELLRQKFDYIFFTGSPAVGKIIAKAAAEQLIPVTLELGGKSPCIVDETANLKLSAKRIVWGKFLNCGQSCISPDYILIHESVKQAFIDECRKEIINAFGQNPRESNDYSRIINRKNYDRLIGMMKGKKILCGGDNDAEELYIEPTLLEDNEHSSQLMNEEIFGPLLPLVSYTTEEEASRFLDSKEKPLALYMFSNNIGFVKKIIKNHSFGGGAINDTMVHFANHRLPFGGVGHSGTGDYHGKHSFDAFSTRKGITRRFSNPDITVRYAPYHNKLNLLRLFLKWFS